MYGVAAVWPAFGIVVDAVEFHGADIPALPQEVDGAVVEQPAATVQQFFGVQRGGYFSVHKPFSVEIPDSLFECLDMGCLLIGLRAAPDPMLGRSPGLPEDAHPDHASGTALIEDHLINYQA